MNNKIIGIISDTHGLLRPEVIDNLKNVDLIIHAGDIGNKEIIEKLEEIAPIIAVKGNCDKDIWANKLAVSNIFNINKLRFYLIHDVNSIDINLDEKKIDIVIIGHSHKPMEIKKDNILYLNPGSCGPKRFKLPTTLALMNINDDLYEVSFINI